MHCHGAGKARLRRLHPACRFLLGCVSLSEHFSRRTAPMIKRPVLRWRMAKAVGREGGAPEPEQTFQA